MKIGSTDLEPRGVINPLKHLSERLSYPIYWDTSALCPKIETFPFYTLSTVKAMPSKECTEYCLRFFSLQTLRRRHHADELHVVRQMLGEQMELVYYREIQIVI